MSKRGIVLFFVGHPALEGSNVIINMKTAKALGITFPITLLGRADEVIE